MTTQARNLPHCVRLGPASISGTGLALTASPAPIGTAEAIGLYNEKKLGEAEIVYKDDEYGIEQHLEIQKVNIFFCLLVFSFLFPLTFISAFVKQKGLTR